MRDKILSTLALICVVAGIFACGAGTKTGSSSSSATSAVQSAASNAAVGLPTPAADAKTFTQIEGMTGWNSCGTASCAGGSGNATYWMAQNQTSPSLSGSSMEVYNSGAGADALWWIDLGANDAVTNFLWDFYVQLDSSSTTNAQALEYDIFQFIGGYNYMIGSQCNYAAGVWDVWNELNSQWVPTSVPCQKFTPGVWHHIQWYVQTIPGSHQYHYVTLVVDGTSYAVNMTYSAKDNNWPDNIGVQYQLDVNSGGEGFHQWVDNSTLTVW